MPLVVTDEDGVNVSVGGFIPTPANISASGFATIKRAGGSSQKIVRSGDVVQTHSNNVPVTHQSATVNSSMQSFLTVNSVNVILVGDEASCSSLHLISSTIQSFVNVIPK
jgi:hypothetical protein